MALSPTSSRTSGGGTQYFVRVTLRHSADFANLSGNAPVVPAAVTVGQAAALVTLPPSLFGDASIIDVLVANDNAVAVKLNGSLVVQNAAGTVWIEQDMAALQTIPAGTSASLNFSTAGGGVGVGLTWNNGTKQVDIASSGVYSAFVTLEALLA